MSSITPTDEFLARRRASHAERESNAPASVVAIGDHMDPLDRIYAECMADVARMDKVIEECRSWRASLPLIPPSPANLRCTGCERHWYADDAQAFAGSPCLHESTLEDHCSGRIQIL